MYATYSSRTISVQCYLMQYAPLLRQDEERGYFSLQDEFVSCPDSTGRDRLKLGGEIIKYC